MKLNLWSFAKDVTGSSTFLGPVLVVSGVGLFIYEIYYWLRNAQWPEHSLLWPLSYIDAIQSWVYYPTEWIGIHKILDVIPLYIFLVIIGILITNLTSE